MKLQPRPAVVYAATIHLLCAGAHLEEGPKQAASLLQKFNAFFRHCNLQCWQNRRPRPT